MCVGRGLGAGWRRCSIARRRAGCKRPETGRRFLVLVVVGPRLKFSVVNEQDRRTILEQWRGKSVGTAPPHVWIVDGTNDVCGYVANWPGVASATFSGGSTISNRTGYCATARDVTVTARIPGRPGIGLW